MNQNLYEFFFSKTKKLATKDKAIVEVFNTLIQEVNEVKGLGLIVTNNLNRTEIAKTRSAKALQALYSVKKHISNYQQSI